MGGCGRASALDDARSTFSSSSLKAYPAAPWHCFLQQYAAQVRPCGEVEEMPLRPHPVRQRRAQYISTPLMVLNSAYDQWQILNDLGLGCVPSTTGQPVAGVPSCNAAQMAVFQQYRLAQLQAVAPVLAGYPHNGAFIDSCFVHEQVRAQVTVVLVLARGTPPLPLPPSFTFIKER